ncbi:MAG: GNAT family N-acetyltransferase [Actinocatenispora sp.]
MISEQLARAEAALADLTDIEGDSALVAGVRCAALGVAQPWGTYARPVRPPACGDFRQVIDWLSARSTQWTVKVSARDVGAPIYRGLREWLALPVYVLAAPDALDRTPTVSGLDVTLAHSPDEFLRVYGTELAPLVTDRRLASKGYRFLVARLDGRPVGCAQVRRAEGTVYISAVTVRPEYRRRGIGAAISTAASRLALTLADDGPVWLHASDEPGRVYRRIGYRQVDEHVLLTA